MKRLAFLALLLACACTKDKEKSETAPLSNAQPGVAQAAQAAQPSAVASPAQPKASSVSYQGTFAVSRKVSTTTKKEGAPQAWDKDDGKRFSGEGQVSLTVSETQAVSGTLSGALGKLAVRGSVEGDELRAQLVPTGNDMTQIQNGFLSLKRAGEGYQGQLVAASGDALVLREAKLTLSKIAP